MRAALLIATLILSTATARADGVGVVVTGDATVQPQLAAQVEDWLRERGHQLIAAPLRPEALGTMIDCVVIEDVACARTVFEQSAAPRLLFAKAELGGTAAARDITILGYWFTRGADPSAVRRTCTACTDAAMRAIIDEMMSSLAGTARVDQGTLELAINPPGARVRIDGAEAGPSPLTLPVGVHIVEVSADDHAPERREVTIKGGEKTSLAVQLSARGRDKKPLFVIGGGGLLLATGVVLFATSEEDTGAKPEYRDTRAGGIALSAVGVAAIAAGVYLYLRNGPTDSAPAVAVTPGAAYVGWVRTF